MIIKQAVNQAVIWMLGKLNELHNLDSDKFSQLCEKLSIYVTTKNHRFSPVTVFKKENMHLTSWCDGDRLINKILSIYLAAKCKNNLSSNCMHIKGNGSLPKVAKKVSMYNKEFKYVYKTDIYSYYNSINHRVLLCYFIKNFGHNHFVTKLVWKHLRHQQNLNGTISQNKQGLVRGSSLSPILSAIYLDPLDKLLDKRKDIKFIRYVDDIIVFSNNLNSLTALKDEIDIKLKKLKLKIRPEKSYLGKVSDGFDFCGFGYNKNGLIDLAAKTKNKFVNKVITKSSKHPNRYLDNTEKTVAESLFGDAFIYFKHFNAWAKGVAAASYQDIKYRIRYAKIPSPDHRATLKTNNCASIDLPTTALPIIETLYQPVVIPSQFEKVNTLQLTPIRSSAPYLKQVSLNKVLNHQIIHINYLCKLVKWNVLLSTLLQVRLFLLKIYCGGIDNEYIV